MELDGSKDRSGLLALLELEKRARIHGVTTGLYDFLSSTLRSHISSFVLEPSRMVTLMKTYFERIGDKACCFEDLKPYLSLDDDDLSQWTAYLNSVSPSFVSCAVSQRSPD